MRNHPKTDLTAAFARTEQAYRAWRKAAERGYGERDHTIEHMRKVDARIARLKARYEALLLYQILKEGSK